IITISLNIELRTGIVWLGGYPTSTATDGNGQCRKRGLPQVKRHNSCPGHIPRNNYLVSYPDLRLRLKNSIIGNEPRSIRATMITNDCILVSGSETNRRWSCDRLTQGR